MSEAQVRKHVRVPGTDEHVHFEQVPGILPTDEGRTKGPLDKLLNHRILGAREKHE